MVLYLAYLDDGIVYFNFVLSQCLGSAWSSSSEGAPKHREPYMPTVP